MTKAFYERGLRIWMVVFAISFVIADGLFLFGLDPLFKFLNWEAAQVGLPPSPVPAGNKWFFLALTNSMMVMITYMAVALAVNPWKYFTYLPVLIVSKTTSALTGLVFYFTTKCNETECWGRNLMEGTLGGTPYFSNLSVFTSDAPLAIIAVVLYLQGRRFLAAAKPAGPVAS